MTTSQNSIEDMVEQESTDNSESQVLEGEVVGYDVQALAQLIIEDLDSAVARQALSHRTAQITKALVIDWSNQLRQHGVTIINIESE